MFKYGDKIVYIGFDREVICDSDDEILKMIRYNTYTFKYYITFLSEPKIAIKEAITFFNEKEFIPVKEYRKLKLKRLCSKLVI